MCRRRGGITLKLTGSPGDETFLNTADDLEPRDATLEGKKKTFIDDQTKLFEHLLGDNSFKAAEKQLAIVKPMVDTKTKDQLQATLDDRKSIYVSKLLAAALGYMQKGDVPGAYRYFVAAYALNVPGLKIRWIWRKINTSLKRNRASKINFTRINSFIRWHMLLPPMINSKSFKTS